MNNVGFWTFGTSIKGLSVFFVSSYIGFVNAEALFLWYILIYTYRNPACMLHFEILMRGIALASKAHIKRLRRSLSQGLRERCFVILCFKKDYRCTVQSPYDHYPDNSVVHQAQNILILKNTYTLTIFIKLSNVFSTVFCITSARSIKNVIPSVW
jgi:hypothetical protein